MIIEGLQWDYDGGGMSPCGPCEGSYIAELQFRDNDGVQRFACLSAFQDSRQLRFAHQSLFDHEMKLFGSEDFDAALDELDSMTDSVIDYADGDYVDESLEGDPFRNVVRLLRLAMHTYLEIENDDKKCGNAQSFIAPYIGVDVDTLDIPVVTESVDDDEEYEDDEEN